MNDEAKLGIHGEQVDSTVTEATNKRQPQTEAVKPPFGDDEVRVIDVIEKGKGQNEDVVLRNIEGTGEESVVSGARKKTIIVGERADEVKNRIRELQDELSSEGKPLSPEMLQYTEGAKEWLRSYFKETAGIDTVEWDMPIVAVDTIADNVNNLGVAGGDGIRIAEGAFQALYEDDDIRQLMEATVILEELYHTAGSLRQRGIQDDGELIVHLERGGLSYNSTTYKAADNNSVEEGLAAIARTKGFNEFVKQQFPEAAEKYDALLQRDGAAQVPDTSDDDKWLLEQKGNSSTWCLAPHINSKLLVENYLTKFIPNFVQLAEKARVNGETLGLARAVTREYGKGSYTDLMLGSDADVGHTKVILNSGRNLRKPSTK